MSFARVSKWHAWCTWHAELCPTVPLKVISSSFPEGVIQLSSEEVSIWNPSILLADTYWIDWHEEVTVFLPLLLIQRQEQQVPWVYSFSKIPVVGWEEWLPAEHLASPPFPPCPFFLRMRCSQTAGQNLKSPGGALAHCQNRSSFDWSENSSYDFVLVPKDHWASTYLAQQITHGSWQHCLILRDVKVILSKSEGFWCTWMCSKPFRYCRQLLNKSFFLIAYHPKRCPDFCSSRNQVQL